MPPPNCSSAVRAVAGRPDGGAVVSGSDDKTLKVWRAARGGGAGGGGATAGKTTAMAGMAAHPAEADTWASKTFANGEEDRSQAN